MLSYYIIANGKQKVEYTNGKNNGRESQSKTSEIGEKESMEQGGSSATAVFVMPFFMFVTIVRITESALL